jgi:hypothetical protein
MVWTPLKNQVLKKFNANLTITEISWQKSYYHFIMEKNIMDFFYQLPPHFKSEIFQPLYYIHNMWLPFLNMPTSPAEPSISASLGDAPYALHCPVTGSLSQCYCVLNSNLSEQQSFDLYTLPVFLSNSFWPLHFASGACCLIDLLRKSPVNTSYASWPFPTSLCSHLW